MSDVTAYVGLTETEAVDKAKESGLKTRITARDGEHFMVTMDYHMGRVNFQIEGGKVASANRSTCSSRSAS